MSLRIEILISTMFKQDLTFLQPMFIHNNIDDFDLIIVNQTTENKLLVSDKTNIKIINSYERGSPASRNLAIQNATQEVCLMSDDDIVYQPNLKEKIIEAYQTHPKAAMISFEAVDESGKLYTNYHPEGVHNKKSLKKIYTWVITFNRKLFRENAIYFNRYFGVGSVFKGETEYVFLRNAFDKELPMLHVAQTIVMHPNESSGRQMGSDNAIFARAALNYRFYGNFSYIWVFKYVLFLIRHNYISIKEIVSKIITGFDGIKTYKHLKRNDLIEKI